MIVVPTSPGPGGLAVLLLHATDAPDLAVAGVRAALAAQAADIDSFARPPPVALVLDADGARLGAKGVAGALSTGGRPNLVAQLADFVARKGLLLVVEPAWRDRGFLDDALIPGAKLVGAGHLARLAAAHYAIATY